MSSRSEGWGLPLFTLLATLPLAVLPLPALIAPFRPDWAAVMLLYWSLLMPRRFGLLTAFWLGLALDALTGALLGQHALALIIIVYLAQRFHLRIRVFPASQLWMTVIVLLALYQFVLFWIDGVAGRTVPATERWAPVVSGAALWLVLASFNRFREPTEVRI